MSDCRKKLIAKSYEPKHFIRHTLNYQRHANLSVAHLVGADLSNANLSNANLSESKLRNSIFINTNLDNTNFTGASVFHAKLQEAVNVPQNIISTYKSTLIDNPNKELLNAMIAKSKGLYHPSEASEPYELFLWERKYFGDFSLDKLLELTPTLKIVDRDGFVNSISAINMNISNPQIIIKDANKLNIAFKEYIKTVNPYLTIVELYQFETRAINDYSSIMPHIAIGQTKNGDWLAITTLFEDELHQEYTQNSKSQGQTMDINNDETNKELVKTIADSSDRANSLLPNLMIFKSFHWDLANKREVGNGFGNWQR